MRLSSVLLLLLFIISSVIAGLLFMGIEIFPSEEDLIIGIFPRRSSVITQRMYRPMAQYLSQKLKRRVHINTAKTFNEFWYGVKSKKYHLVHFNQYHYIVSKAQFGYEVIAMNEENGKSTITGAIIIRKDSGIHNVMDLKGKKILFGGGPKAMQSYIYPSFLLLQAGLKKSDYITEFDSNPPNAITSMYYGLSNAVAAGAGDAALKIVANKIDTSQLSVLVEGDQFASLPWAVKNDIDIGLKSRIQSLMLGLKNTKRGRAILKSAKLSALVYGSDQDYNPHRKIVKAVYGDAY